MFKYKNYTYRIAYNMTQSLYEINECVKSVCVI
jgi:hypothetical protein